MVVNSRWTFIVCSVLLCVACGSGQSSKQKPLNYPNANTQAAKVYVSKCSQCHVAPLPSAHVATVWPSTIQRMQIHMSQQGVVALTKGELSDIMDYLQENAKR